MTAGEPLVVMWIALPLLAATLAPLMVRALGSRAGWLLAVAPLAVAALAYRTLPADPAAPLLWRWPWAPALGVELAFLADGLSLTFVLLIAGIGAAVVVYAGGYLGHDRRLGGFFTAILTFMAAMLGLVLADNIFTLFVFWEATSLVSYVLIGFDSHTRVGRAAALKALLVTGGGGLVLLLGLIMLAVVGGQLGLAPSDAASLSGLAAVDVRGHALYPAIVVAILIGCLTKSAQVPFHFWLPAAMAGPTPVSAFLHSATMVKAGVYLLARVHPVLGDTDLWHAIVAPVGLVTMLTAAVMALAQRDLKRVLAFSTVSVLGTLVMLLGIGTELAIKTSLVFLLAHGLYKAALFMVAGNVDHEAGTRDLTALGGLRRAMPWTALAGLLAAASKAGAPPMFGFIGKELLYTAKLDLEHIGAWLIIAAVAANVALVASALMVSVRPFLGRPTEAARGAHEAPLEMVLGPVLLALFGLGRGLQPEPFERTLGSAAATAIAGRPVTMDLALWHGVDPKALAVMGLSLLTLALGWGVYRLMHLERLSGLVALARRASVVGPERAFHAGLEGLPRIAAALTRWLQGGVLRRYLLVTLSATVVAAGAPLIPGVGEAVRAVPGGWRVHEVTLSAVVMVSAVATVLVRSRLAAVASLGVTGISVALLFLLFGAPDLALTQIVVEALAVILLVLVFLRLPERQRRCTDWQRLRDGVVATAGGAVAALAVLLATSTPGGGTLRDFYLEHSQPAAHGRNVVNVILVDFRALDTLGEITVLATAGIGVWALLRLGGGRRRGGS